MAFYGPKIFPDGTIELQNDVLDLCTESNGLEVSLSKYIDYSDEITERIHKIDTHKKIIHLWQQKVYLNGLIENNKDCYDSFHWELERCYKLGIEKAVIHNNIAATPKYIDNPEEHARNSIRVIEYAYNHKIKLYLENIFKPFSFYERFFAELDRLGVLPMFGFCLDTGHARVYNGSTLDKWLDFIIHIHKAGADIHYHIHVNDGTTDQHTTLSKAYTNGLLEPVDSWTPTGYIDWLKRASIATPNAIFCQEHPASEAREAMAFIKLLQEDKLIF